ncbi:MAG: TMEM175 family protein, partial [Mucilaginibacter sp.]
YLLSFVNVGLYWNNHHHLFYLVESITGTALWANLNLLFWLSLIPFTTAWMGSNHFSQWTVIAYGAVLIMCAISYTILAYVLASHCGKNSALAEALGEDWKGKASLGIYVVGIITAFFNPIIALALYASVAVIWFIPDRRIERRLRGQDARK